MLQSCLWHFILFESSLSSYHYHVKFLLYIDSFEQVLLLKALSSAHDILIEELQNLSKAINEPIDVEDIASRKLFGFIPRSDQDLTDPGVPVQVPSKPLNVSEVL